MTLDPRYDPTEFLSHPAALRERLALALRQVEILRGLVRLAESVARRDGRPADMRVCQGVSNAR